MSEIKRISVSLKVDESDELYWALIQPLQQNRQLASFLLTLLQAYKDDSDVHDRVDSFAREFNGVEKLREQLSNLIDIQSKAVRYSDDIRNTLGDDSDNSEEGIKSIFDTDEPHVDANEVKVSSDLKVGDIGILSDVLKRLVNLEGSMQVIQDRLGVAPNGIGQRDIVEDESQSSIVDDDSNRGIKQSQKTNDPQDSIDIPPDTSSDPLTPLAETPKNDVENVEKSVEKSSKGSDNPYLKSMVADLLGDMSF